MAIPANKRLSFVDRSGRHYTREEFQDIMRKVYPRSPKAFMLLFPEYPMMSLKSYARDFKIKTRSFQFWNEELDEICRALYPDYDSIAKQTGRTRKAVVVRCSRLKLCAPKTREWTSEEVLLLRAGQKPATRSQHAAHCKSARIGLSLSSIRNVRATAPRDLVAKIEALIPRGYPTDKRSDALQSVMEACLTGRCNTADTNLRAEVKRAISAVYKLHPDRGAPVSLDAKLFDDGGTTVGDRIASDAFHF